MNASGDTPKAACPLPAPGEGWERPALSATPANPLLAELEAENRRLQILVAELLIKNQQLRKPPS